MAEAAATYPTGMSVTRTTAPQAMPYEYALALMGAQDKYRSDTDAWQRANWYRQQATVPRATNYTGGIGRSAAEPVRDAVVRSSPMAPVRSDLDRARERAEILKAQALTRGPNLRYTYGNPSAPSHLEMDTDHMSALERALFLPQASSFVPDDVALMRARYGYR